MKKNIAFIGLGVMGFPMAGYLQQAGHQVTVFNRTMAKAEQWLKQYDGAMALNAAKASEHADIVCLCVGRDEDVREMVTGPLGILSSAAPGTLIIDHTTTSDALAREMAAACADAQCRFIDAPVSGGQSGAETGQLSIMCGGSQADFDEALPVLQHYAKQCQRIGDVGAGQLAKMMNQICIAGILQGLAESLHFGEQAGLDRSKVLEVISQGAAQSWQMDNRAHTMIDDQYDFGFAVDWMRKDLGYALNSAKGHGASLPLTALVDQFYADVQKLGGGRMDTSSLLKRCK